MFRRARSTRRVQVREIRFARAARRREKVREGVARAHYFWASDWT
jgi:hypothetical protein